MQFILHETDDKPSNHPQVQVSLLCPCFINLLCHITKICKKFNPSFLSSQKKKKKKLVKISSDRQNIELPPICSIPVTIIAIMAAMEGTMVGMAMKTTSIITAMTTMDLSIERMTITGETTRINITRTTATAIIPHTMKIPIKGTCHYIAKYCVCLCFPFSSVLFPPFVFPSFSFSSLPFSDSSSS